MLVHAYVEARSTDYNKILQLYTDYTTIININVNKYITLNEKVKNEL